MADEVIHEIIDPEEWTNSTRPVSPWIGQTGLNTETGQFEGWNGTAWIVMG